MAKKKNKLVRLANGEIEPEENVGAIVLALREFQRDRPDEFITFCRWYSRGGALPGPVEAVTQRLRLLKPGRDEPELYDDVKDVLDSVLDWRGSTPRLGSSPLHADQTDIEVPE